MKKLMSKIALLVFIFFCSVMTVVRPSFFVKPIGPTSRVYFKFIPKVQNQFSFYLKTYWLNFRSWLARPKRLDPKNVNLNTNPFKEKNKNQTGEEKNQWDVIQVD